MPRENQSDADYFSPVPASEPVIPGVHAFGQLIRAYRRRAGLSQAGLASALEINRTTLSRIERGESKAPQDVAFFDRLRENTAVTNLETRLLLRCMGAPTWLFDDVLPPRSIPSPIKGVMVTIEMDPELQVNDQEINRLQEWMESAMEDFALRR